MLNGDRSLASRDPDERRRRRPWPYLLGLGLAFAVIVAAWVTRGLRQPVGPGSAAPDFSAETLHGDSVGLEEFPGSVVLLNIWATWCPPCREEMPSMERLYRHFKERGAPFEILAVSIDADEGEKDPFGNEGGSLSAFASEHDLTFTILHDPTGRIQRTYQTTGVPESFLIGMDGVIYRRIAGSTNWDAEGYRDLVHRLLDQGGL